MKRKTQLEDKKNATPTEPPAKKQLPNAYQTTNTKDNLYQEFKDQTTQVHQKNDWMQHGDPEEIKLANQKLLREWQAQQDKARKTMYMDQEGGTIPISDPFQYLAKIPKNIVGRPLKYAYPMLPGLNFERDWEIRKIKERRSMRDWSEDKAEEVKDETVKDQEPLNRIQFDIGPALSKLTQTLTDDKPPQKDPLKDPTERPFATESTPHQFRALWFIAGVSIVLAFAKGATD
jgi:hypothetical protein